MTEIRQDLPPINEAVRLAAEGLLKDHRRERARRQKQAEVVEQASTLAGEGSWTDHVQATPSFTLDLVGTEFVELSNGEKIAVRQGIWPGSSGFVVTNLLHKKNDGEPTIVASLSQGFIEVAGNPRPFIGQLENVQQLLVHIAADPLK